MRTAIEGLDGVKAVEDLHVWSLFSQIAVASVFVTDTTSTSDEQDALVAWIHELLESERESPTRSQDNN